MSIIYEALKKVEKNQGLRENKKNTDEKEIFKSKTSKNRFFSGKIIIFIFVGILVCLGLILNLTGRKDNLEMMANKTTEKIEIVSQQVEQYPEIVPGVYALEGVVQDGENSFVVVNGKILKMFDKIDDFTVNRISGNEVELLNLKDNSKLILSLSF